MASQRPLIFDAARAVSRQLEANEGLSIGGDLDLTKGAGFWGATAPAAQPALGGEWADSLDALLRLLDATGFARDTRPAGWLAQAQASAALGKLGPYSIGRLITGSASGWVALDQPTAAAGVLQVAVAHQGTPQTPAGGGPAQRGLAYLPLLSYGTGAPPSGAVAGCIWYDDRNTGGRVPQAMIYNGSIWVPLLPAALSDLVSDLAAARRGAVLTADGSGGITALSNVQAGDSTGPAGQVVVFDRDGGSSAIDLLTVDGASPWPNGGSAFAVAPGGGGRPVGVHQALWGCNTPGSESLGFWDEAAQRWKTVPVASPVLQQLAALSSSLTDGDMLLMRGGQLERLPAGDPGDELVCRPEPAWHARQTHGPTLPPGAIDGDLHLDTQPQGATESGGTNRLYMRLANTWETIYSPGVRYSAVNTSGGSLRVCTPVVLVNDAWQLTPATGADGARPIVGIVITQNTTVANGQSVAAIVSGIAQAAAANWNLVMDASSIPPSSGSGLEPGRRYYLSPTEPGKLTNNPPGGVGLLVGTAMAANRLLVQPAMTSGGQALARLANEPAAPTLPEDGLLWWNRSAGQLNAWDASQNAWEKIGAYAGYQPCPPSLQGIPRNLMVNGDLQVIAPVPVTPVPDMAWYAENWRMDKSGSSYTWVRNQYVQDFNIPGHSYPRASATITTTSGGGPNDFVRIVLSGRGSILPHKDYVHTLSFYARASAPAFLSTEFKSPAVASMGLAELVGVEPRKHALTTDWQFYTVTFTWPANENYSATRLPQVVFWLDAGSSFDARTAGLGHQDASIELCNVQLEIGEEASPFELLNTGITRELCASLFTQKTLYRYFRPTVQGRRWIVNVDVPTTMRGTPTITSEIVNKSRVDVYTAYAAGSVGDQTLTYIIGLEEELDNTEAVINVRVMMNSRILG